MGNSCSLSEHEAADQEFNRSGADEVCFLQFHISTSSTPKKVTPYLDITTDTITMNDLFEHIVFKDLDALVPDDAHENTISELEKYPLLQFSEIVEPQQYLKFNYSMPE